MAAAPSPDPQAACPAGPTIGGVALRTPFLLAPMAGVTDPPFRRLARRFGAALAATEMTTADTSLWTSRKSRLRLDFGAEPSPRAVQIAGSEPKQMAAAASALEQMGADIIDINMGCPAKKVCRKLAGSALLSDERLVADILGAVVAAVSIPVTLKTRTGWNRSNINAPAIARIAEDSGIQALAIHGRTRACRYAGNAEYDTIAEIATTISIPLFANGDIDSSEKAHEVMRVSGADGILIGRAAQGQPWLFRDIEAQYFTGKPANPLPRLALRDIILAHLEDIYRFYGEHAGVRVARKHLTWYCRNFENSEAFRFQVVRVESAAEQLRLTRQFVDSGTD